MSKELELKKKMAAMFGIGVMAATLSAMPVTLDLAKGSLEPSKAFAERRKWGEFGGSGESGSSGEFGRIRQLGSSGESGRSGSSGESGESGSSGESGESGDDDLLSKSSKSKS